ncbi:MAG: hypothetical protein ABSC95_12010 [Acetobacteraceae bacterium]
MSRSFMVAFTRRPGMTTGGDIECQAKAVSFRARGRRRMHRIGDRQFLHAWQRIRAGTQPDPEAMTWRIGDVMCRRHRHSLMGPDHRIVLDICHLEPTGNGANWQVMVTAEHWWDRSRTVIRSQLWASHLSGSRERALAWFFDTAATLDRRGAAP